MMLILPITFAVSAVAQSKKSDHLQEAMQAIEKSNAIYFQSLVKNDPIIFIDRYAEDGCIMAPNSKMLCGKDGFREFFEGSYSLGIRNGKFMTTTVYGEGNEYVVEEGFGEIYDAEGKIIDDFKYLVLWKKTNRGWKMFRDSFSSNRVSK